ncbi:MAG: hypothetical protein ACRDT6_09610 [Micromonosporaceae bacterium]
MSSEADDQAPVPDDQAPVPEETPEAQTEPEPAGAETEIGAIEPVEPVRARRSWVVASLAVVLALALAGGGAWWWFDNRPAGGDGLPTAGGNGTAASGAPGSEKEQMRKFAKCMREHGVQMPDPETDGDGGSLVRIPDGEGSDKAEEAMRACRKFLPNGGAPPKLSAEDLELARKFAKCMRENGVPEFPDPDPDGRQDVTVDQAEAGAFEAAMEKCRQYQPRGQKRNDR